MQEKTAIDSYWEAAQEGVRIPVAFPFETFDGRPGLAAQGVPMNHQAAVLATSNDSRDRAAAAVLALNFVMTRFSSQNHVKLAP